jgi:hypothetical protein
MLDIAKSASIPVLGIAKAPAMFAERSLDRAFRTARTDMQHIIMDTFGIDADV